MSQNITSKLLHSWSHGSNWIIDLVPLKNNTLVAASLSNGEIHIYSLSSSSSFPSSAKLVIKAHANCIAKLIAIDDSTIATCSTDAVKVWNIDSPTPQSPSYELSDPKGIAFLSLAYSPLSGYLAAGTELKSSDAHIHLWDLNNQGKLVRSLVETQHDDVTALAFHPTNKKLLLSGSTDGCINVFDLSQELEDDCLYQVVEFASIHSAGWLTSTRIFGLTHMETFGVAELNDMTVEAAIEPKPLEFGDIREKWGCEYVVDLYVESSSKGRGYVACGSINDKNQVKLVRFAKEKLKMSKSVIIDRPHGEEIARCVLVSAKHPNLVFTGGEDGKINVWEMSSPLTEVLKLAADQNEEADVEMDDSEKKNKNHKIQEHKKNKKRHGKEKTKIKKQKFSPY
ncbi:hypothetical protein DASC09_056000 [Saccharomycopsis crataegensis]|uniref:WD repeat-containing protein n=1 Tax=Saccharomycopsis crataegensis TaxID=43959 RepID=A0AAV5QU76_9ASCO|nr:hypothetical protein DASC09_056000 [Saccharomycopsis crataegensis]